MPNNNEWTLSVVVPAFNEEAILEANVHTLFDYLRGLEDKYRWQVLLVNDGSSDETGDIAERLATKYKEFEVIHHPANFGLGQAFKTAFRSSRGEYIVSLELCSSDLESALTDWSEYFGDEAGDIARRLLDAARQQQPAETSQPPPEGCHSQAPEPRSRIP